MSDANKSSLAYQYETTLGVLPVSPALGYVRMTGETLIHDKTTVVSEEIIPTREVSDLVQVGAKASGPVNFEGSHTQLKNFAPAILFSAGIALAFSGAATLDLSDQTAVITGGGFAGALPGCSVRLGGAGVAGNNGIKKIVSVSVDGNTLTFAAGSIAADESVATLTVNGTLYHNGVDRKSFYVERSVPDGAGTGYLYQSFRGMVVDQFDLSVESMKIVTGTLTFLGLYGTAGATSLMQDGTGAKATGTLTLSGNAVADETVTIAGKTYTWKGSVGATANQVLVGATASDSIDNLVAAITGGAGAGTLYGSATVTHTTVTAVNGAGDTLVVTAISKGTAANAYGTTETMTNGSWGGATLSGGVNVTAVTAAPTDPVLNGTTNVARLERDGLVLDDHFKTFAITLKNNARALDALGILGAFDIGAGRCEVTGKASAYFASNDLVSAFIDHDATAFAIQLTDADGATIVINLPRVKLSKGNTNVSGLNTDNMIDLEFQAIHDPSTNCQIAVSFVPAAA